MDRIQAALSGCAFVFVITVAAVMIVASMAIHPSI